MYIRKISFICPTFLKMNSLPANQLLKQDSHSEASHEISSHLRKPIFVTNIIRACYVSLSTASQITSTMSHPTPLRSILNTLVPPLPQFWCNKLFTNNDTEIQSLMENHQNSISCRETKHKSGDQI